VDVPGLVTVAAVGSYVEGVANPNTAKSAHHVVYYADPERLPVLGGGFVALVP
jgi:hypothetical protein